jgi:hypothetical protein
MNYQQRVEARRRIALVEHFANCQKSWCHRCEGVGLDLVMKLARDAATAIEAFESGSGRLAARVKRTPPGWVRKGNP